MVDQIPAHAWLLIAIGAAAFPSARYIFQHIAATPSRRDITQPPADLGWRTSGQLVRSLAVLALLAGLAIFIFTPAAGQLAKSPRFLPLVAAVIGVWALSTVPLGLASGRVRPFVRGISEAFQRGAQPKRFWASLAWNALLGSLSLWLAYQTNKDASRQILDDRCFAKTATSRQDLRAACDELIGGYDDAIRRDRGDYYAHYDRASAYQQLGDSQRAVGGYSEAIRLKPKDADAYVDRGLIFLDSGAFDRALADFSLAHQLNPKSPWPLANRGITYAWKGDRPRAKADFKAARGIDRSNPVLLRGEALLAFNGGDMKLAVGLSTATLKAEPDNLFSLALRADAYRRLGDHQKSRADTDRLSKLDQRTR